MTQPLKSPSADFERRRPVWVAIADLFLDTELDENALKGIALVMKASGYSLEELDYIYWREVGPAVGANAMCVAGVWTGFDEKWLVNAILARSGVGDGIFLPWQATWDAESYDRTGNA